MFQTTKALVLREVKYKEADRILTLLTADNGKITAKARGALRRSSKTGAATQQLTYADMTLFLNKGKWTVNEASVIEPFEGLKGDIAHFALGCYFAECAEALSVEDQRDDALLSLVLNSLYALSRDLHDARKIKAPGFRPCRRTRLLPEVQPQRQHSHTGRRLARGDAHSTGRDAKADFFF